MKAGDTVVPRDEPTLAGGGAAPGQGPSIQLTVLVAATHVEKDRVVQALADGRRAGPPALVVRGGDGHARWPAPPRLHPTWQEVHAAEGALRSARRRLAELREEETQLGDDGGELPRAARVALRLAGEAPAYRSQLLQLAAVRARLVDLERTILHCERRLGGGNGAGTGSDELGPWADELPAWQARVGSARAAHAGAERAGADASSAVRELCEQVSAELTRDVFDGGDAVDVAWRRLWHLRRHLEEIWEVQSHAEAGARALAEREAALQAREAAAHWLPSPRLQAGASAAAIAATLAALWSALWAGSLPDAALWIAAAVLVLIRAALLLRVRFASLREQRRLGECERLRADVTRLRRERDADWARAAQLTAAIDAGAAALRLASPVTPEMVDTCERAMAAALRQEGGGTALTALLLDLLEREEREQRARAALADADAERRAIEREWVAWRAEVGLPAVLDAERIGEWLEARTSLAEALAARDAARAQHAALEPATATWEAAVRDALAAAGRPVATDLCGRALTAALAALASCVRAERQRAQRRRRIADEVHAAEAAVVAAVGALERIRADRQALCNGTAAAGRWVPALRDAAAALEGEREALGAAGVILATATGGAYAGFRQTEDGSVLVVDGDDRGVAVDDVRDRASRRGIELLMRLGEALPAPRRSIVFDDVLAALDDGETAVVAAAIAAVAATRPLVYVTTAVSRQRTLALLPAGVAVVECGGAPA